MKKIELPELKYLGFCLLFILIFMIIINNFETSIDNLNPVIQFLLFNIGISFMFVFIFKAIAKKKKISRIIEGALASTISFISLDLILPEYHINSHGLIKGGLLGQASSDYFFGYVYQSIFNITNGLFLQILVYGVTFSLLVLLGSYLYKDFLKNI